MWIKRNYLFDAIGPAQHNARYVGKTEKFMFGFDRSIELVEFCASHLDRFFIHVQDLCKLVITQN